MKLHSGCKGWSAKTVCLRPPAAILAGTGQKDLGLGHYILVPTYTIYLHLGAVQLGEIRPPRLGRVCLPQNDSYNDIEASE